MKKIMYASMLLLAISSINAKSKKTKNKEVKVERVAKTYRHDIEYSNLYYKHTTTAQEAREPKENTVIGLDMNGVLFDKHYQAIPSIMNDIRRKEGLWYTCKLVKASRQLNKERIIIGSDNHKEKLCWDAVLTKHENPNDPLYSYIANIRMATTRINVLNIPMTHLLYNLHNQGHHPHVFSNMGKNVLQSIVTSLEKHQPTGLNKEEFSYILSFLKNKTHSFISSQQNDWVIKPNPKTYEHFLGKNKTVKGKKIFIDDKKQNVIAAIENGFDFAILYKNTENLNHILFEILQLKR